ncbi:hypothetical protein NAL32_18170 [Chryseobacterium sp. Ch-15]|uniref:DUF6438 domain-containing protein n=1 Tax=Chryseobacterium muglaense TaxID=2893752 RepID=A0A9Q3USH4_9FLAO|nr:hypothetical protein [Chryseobacterium muglaense]MBD3906561.1 hypothetical protein [Chryseobacterium muglaense]MCC9033567.1 hypothetical protein [Chryseobacterium muglaense]MCM2556315.1 hypothetical protein [Chryseobacterium muglaense]
MKFIYFLIGIFILQSCEKKSLTEKEILEIIHSNDNYKDLELKTDFINGYEFIDSIKIFRETIKKEYFKCIYEADFNNDGKIDYLVNLSYPKTKDNNLIRINEDNISTVVLLSSVRDYQLLNPGKSNVYDIVSAKIINYKNKNLIKLLSISKNFDNKIDILEADTLMIKNNELTEFVNSTQNHHIEKIIFTKKGGYSPGIKYQLTLKKDSVILNSNFYKNLKGKYICKNNSKFEKAAKYLNEINFSDLKDNYFINCEDCSSIVTEITFDNGKSKKINDYGEKGSLNLLRFYEKKDSIMSQQKWKKTN